ncbi:MULTISPECIES: TetR/AcrR family transcriptional regulator [unclassified Ruegeria]|uniref:TetR/AcrR family transcriptional regulator n=1 Tax=unclassified Ruegeria TaxID=2625375 RepID=UPI001487A0E5|nr:MULTISPECIES: TetR/AcrR family transcriptional regulator [unclassified Ruegeria]
MVTAPTISGVDPRDVMNTFAQYGFRKTSMEDIAKAVRLSRQSIYKKFGSKESCYTWALRTYTETLYRNVFELLEKGDGAPLQVLEEVLLHVVSDSLEISKTDHGAKLLEDALEIAAAQPENWPGAYVAKLGEFLLRQGLASTSERAQDLSYLVITAARGALVISQSKEDFVLEIRRLLLVIFVEE